MLRISALFLLLTASALAGQQRPMTDAQRILESRAELEALLEELQQTAASTAYSETLRRRARDEARLIEQRLQTGDFRNGDRIYLSVSQGGQAWFADSLMVEPGPSVYIDPIGDVDLRGVLRSELEGHLLAELRRYLRDPTIREASPTIRLTITGGATQQGEIYFPAVALIGSAISQAGLPPSADVESIAIYRGGEVLWDEEAVALARQEGRTLDQLSLQAGDEIRIPVRTPGSNWVTYLQVGLGLITAVSIIIF